MTLSGSHSSGKGMRAIQARVSPGDSQGRDRQSVNNRLLPALKDLGQAGQGYFNALIPQKYPLSSTTYLTSGPQPGTRVLH
jgi:hypothetical protein